MKIPLKLIMPTGAQAYDCAGCGECCRGKFAIVISEEDKIRLDAQNWDAEELGLAGKPLLTRARGGYQMAHRSDGACVFLTDDNRCRIHAKFGEPAKPLPCRLYPFQFVTTGNQTRIDLRFDCPTVAKNLGRPIETHQSSLRELKPNAVPKEAASENPPSFFDDVRLTWAELERVTHAFERILNDISLDLTRRVTACVNLADILRHPEIAQAGRELGNLLDEAVSDVQQMAAADTLTRVAPPNTQRAIFRQLLGVYGRLDTVGERVSVPNRLAFSLKMLAGRGDVPRMRDDFPRVAFAQIEQSSGIPGSHAAAAFERYLSVHLSSMGFFGRSFYGRDYLDGLSALLLTYPLLCWFARAYACGKNLSSIDAASAERALQIVDHQHGVTPLLDLPTERHRLRSLCDRNSLRALVLWYGS